MSTQKGNVSRTRTQKHNNKTVFKNDRHDKSHITKTINNIQINNVCARCKDVLEWKIKYKKFKLPKAASTCVSCHEKCVKHAYHTLCGPCAKRDKVCPKCGKSETLIAPTQASFDKSLLKTADIRDAIKALPERKRRTFNRFMEKVLAEGSGDAEISVEDIILEKLKNMSLLSKSDELDDLSDDENDEGESESDES